MSNNKLSTLLTAALVTGLLSAQTAKADNHGHADKDKAAAEKNSCKGKKEGDKNSCKNSCKGHDAKKDKKEDKNSCKNGCGEAK